MIIACDLDGVCFDYDGAARYMLRHYRGQKHLIYPSTDWDYIERMVSPEDWQWLQNEAPKLGLYRYGHVIRGAIVGIHAIQERGHEIHFVTHRPKLAVQDTLDWLSYVRLRPAGVRILTDQEPKRDMGADLYIDDKRETIADIMVNTGRKAICFDQPWNQGGLPGDQDKTRFFRAHDWNEVVEGVDALS